MLYLHTEQSPLILYWMTGNAPVVYTHKHRWRTVTNKFDHGFKQTYGVTVSVGGVSRFIVATSNHQFWVRVDGAGGVGGLFDALGVGVGVDFDLLVAGVAGRELAGVGGFAGLS